MLTDLERGELTRRQVAVPLLPWLQARSQPRGALAARVLRQFEGRFPG